MLFGSGLFTIYIVSICWLSVDGSPLHTWPTVSYASLPSNIPLEFESIQDSINNPPAGQVISPTGNTVVVSNVVGPAGPGGPPPDSLAYNA